MAEVSRQEFAEAVHAALGSVWHLCREVDRLNLALRDELQQEPLRFQSLGGFSSGKKSGDNEDRRVIRNWFGRIYTVGDTQAGEEADGDADEEADDGGDDESTKGHGGRLVSIWPERPFLSVKLVLFDPAASDVIEPEIQYVVLGDWAYGAARLKFPAGAPFTLDREMLRRLLRAVPSAGSTTKGKSIMTGAKVGKPKGDKKKGDRRLSFRCLGAVQTAALYELDSAAALEKLARDIKTHWKAVVAGNAAR
jgi:hypothetical protein